jgi:hypothetical protein
MHLVNIDHISFIQQLPKTGGIEETQQPAIKANRQ